MERTVFDLLKLLDVPVSEAYVKNLLRSHPDFPSLLSISDILQRLGVNHVVHKIDKESLTGLPFPYLLPIEKGQGKILLINSDEDLNKHSAILGDWGGTILQAESVLHTSDNVNDEIYKSEVQIRNHVIGLIVVLGICFIFSFAIHFSWLSLVLFVIALLGVTVAIFLVTKELGVSHALIDAICDMGKNANCDKVLKTDINLVGINLSDAAISYFLLQVIAFGFAPNFPGSISSILQVFSWLSFLTIPIVLFSLYYQGRVVGVWCKLCLAVDVLLILQIGLFIQSYYSRTLQLFSEMPFALVAILGLLLASIMLFVRLIKLTFKRSATLARMGIKGNRIKHAVDVFFLFLLRQKRINAIPFQREILLGGHDANIKIIMVSNLYCRPCKESHERMARLVTMYPHKVSVAIRFGRIGDAEVGRSETLFYILSYWLKYICGKKEEARKTLKLFHEWFDLWDLQNFKMGHQVDSDNIQEVKKIEEQHYEWIKESGVESTPTYFINGYQLPRQYGLDDMIAMVPALSAAFLKTDVENMVSMNINDIVWPNNGVLSELVPGQEVKQV